MSQPIILTTRVRRSYTTYEPRRDDRGVTLEWVRTRHPEVPTVQYGFKWFNVKDGKLRGSYLSHFTYKKGWQKPEKNPSLCRNGYHILNASHPQMNIGDELWIVQVKGVVKGTDKSVAENVRPVVKVCTSYEWRQATNTLHDLVRKAIPEYKSWAQGGTDPLEWQQAVRTLTQAARRRAEGDVPMQALEVLVNRALGKSRPDLRNALASYIFHQR